MFWVCTLGVLGGFPGFCLRDDIVVLGFGLGLHLVLPDCFVGALSLHWISRCVAVWVALLLGG